MSTPTKLSICNGALRLMKEGSLTQSELTNNSREPARLFNAVWDDGGIDSALEAGQWKFAKRVVMLDASPSIEPDPDFGGFKYAFDKPTDFVRIVGLWSDGSQNCPYSDYREEAGFWVANIDPIFMAYVSNDASFGGDYSLWPRSFLKFLHAHFASEIVGPLTSQGKELMQLRRMLLREALQTDGMADPTRQLPVGGWIRSRFNSILSRE